MTQEAFDNIVYTCDYYTEPCNGELVWCTHPDNKCRTEGNCHIDCCPKIKTNGSD